MGRFRARLLAVAVVLVVTVAAAYASLQFTPLSGGSNPSIAVQSPGRIVFSIRNTNPGQLTIVSFTKSFLATDGCTGMSIGHLDGSPVAGDVLDPGKQMQYMVTATGYMNPSLYSCTWTANTNPVDADGPYSITTTFNVATMANVDAQPTAMDFGSQSQGNFETQKILLSNYLTMTTTVNLALMNDPGPDITFADPSGPCTSGVSCTTSIPAGPTGSTQVNIKCQPVNSLDVSAMLVVMAGSAAMATIPVHCNATAGGGSIMIADHPITITGPAGNPATTTTMIFGSGTLGSAAISTLDATFVLPYCGAPSCTWPMQALPYQLAVQCTPDTALKQATLTVYASAGGATDTSTINCTATNSPPFLVAGPINPFPDTLVGAHSDQTIDLSNSGGSQLNGLVITFPGPNGGNWTSLDCTAASPCTIAAGGMVSATIRFQPASYGDKGTQMQLASTNASNTPLSVSLSGTGRGGIMVVTDPTMAPYILDIGQIPRGAPYSRTVTLGNTGNFPYTATESGLSSPYTVSPISQSVDFGQPKDFTVTCQSPTATPTNNEQTLRFDALDAYQGSPQLVTVRCKVEDTLVQVMPNQFDFGEVRITTDPNPRTITVTVTNPAGAGASAQVTSLQLRKAIPGLSLVPPMTDITLQAGASTSATVELSTGSDTTLTDEYLDIAVDNAMLQFPVTGKVVTPHARVAPQRLDLGTACTGTAVSGNIMLINDGTATLAVDPAQMNGSFVASSPGTPGQLAPGMSLVATVAPAMSANGPISGTLSWHEDTPYTHLVPVDLEYVSTGTALSPKVLDFGIVEAGMTSAPQHITLQNCDQTPAKIKVEALRTKQGALSAWIIEPRIGYTKDLLARDIQPIDVTFRPPARGNYEADLDVTTPTGPQQIHLVGEATGRDFDNTSFYACACSGRGAPTGSWPVLAALVVIFRRRRGSSSAR